MGVMARRCVRTGAQQLRPYCPFFIRFFDGGLYEVGEYIVGVFAEPESGLAFFGFQGDIWDTQKDMMIQIVGAVLGLLAWFFVLRRKNFYMHL